MYPFISSIDGKAANATKEDAKLCLEGRLERTKVEGKIVVCTRGLSARVEKGEVVLKAGGAGMILVNDETSGNEIVADAHVLPATHITATDGLALLSYMYSTKSPVAYITHPVTELGTKPAPFMAAFSSQGPNTLTPEILKPDITAPGVSILAAFSQASSPTGLRSDTRRVTYYIDSGTSMSCPHVSGIVGLLKTLHPTWSPAAIRSAIMTTARTRDNMKEPMTNSSFLKATPFSYGAGHVRPNKAMDPGLIYDLTINDYLNFLCSLGYNSSQMSQFSTTPYSCPSIPTTNTSIDYILNLNYPSIAVPNLTGSTTVARTVKNVGNPAAYEVRVEGPKGVRVTVKPPRLEFHYTGEEKMFKVTLEPKKKSKKGHGDYVFGRLIWSDGVHYVRSPIVVKVG